MKKKIIRWGILSTAKIGRELVIPGMKKCADLEISAIGSQSPDKAKKVADQFGIPNVYDSYDALIDDPNIDAIYNPLPNQLHVSLSLKAMEKGKHVLCEKPVAMNAKEAESLRKIPQGIVFMEAFMVRFHPQWLEARRIVESGEIGEVRAIQTFFSYTNLDPENIRNIPETGGGGLFDIGCYATTTSKFLFGNAPERVIGIMDLDPKFKTDRLTSAVYDYGQGRHCTFSVSTQVCTYQRVQVVGTKGRLEIQIPFNAPIDQQTHLFLDDGSNLYGKNIKKIDIAPCDQYQLECEAFNDAVRGIRPLPYGVEDAIENMKILDAVIRSTKTNSWEKP